MTSDDATAAVSEPLYLDDPYARSAPARVVGHDGGGVILDRTIFYPTGGGQPGDSGWLEWAGGRLRIATTVKGAGGAAVLRPEAAEAPLPPAGAAVVQHLDWARRHAHMRMHTALHLLSVVIPLRVTGGSVGAGKGRLDFDMPEAPEDRERIEARLQALIDRDLPVREDWITDAELDARPELVKTMSVSPPRGVGRIRLIRIGAGAEQVDLQPCGGTHVARTGEIGRIRIGRIEKKGRRNRRVYLHLDDIGAEGTGGAGGGGA